MIHVVLGRRADYRAAIDKLQFVLNRRLTYAVADWDRIQAAVDEVYTYHVTEVSNCPLDFAFECPRRWLELRPTTQPAVRFCEACRREVHLCSTEDEALAHAEQGHCVAIFTGLDQHWVDTIGLLDFANE